VKRRYSTAEAAGLDLARIGKMVARVYVPVRAYGCEFCGGWHLTSQAKAEISRNERRA
jgi:hypothetical protein